MASGGTATRGCEPGIQRGGAGRAHSSRAHRNRPLRYDGRVVVTLCTDEVLYLPVTTVITSLPQLTPEGLPLALARRAAEQTRMINAVAELEERGEAVTSRALAAAAHISLNTACTRARASTKRVRLRRKRCYQFCNIVLLAFLITSLRPRTATAMRFQHAHQGR